MPVMFRVPLMVHVGLRSIVAAGSEMRFRLSEPERVRMATSVPLAPEIHSRRPAAPSIFMLSS